MLYKKPSNIRYVDMAIWIDDNAYLDTCDDNKLYEYIYHLVYMLAYKNKLFSKYEYYDSFAIYGATRVFLRLKNKKQFEINYNGDYKLSKIKSVLNYIKTILYPMKVAFEQETYVQTKAKNDEDSLYDIDLDFHSQLTKTIDELNIVDFKCYLNDISKTIYNFLQIIPYSKNKSEWNNIYLSCLLTFLNSITLSNKNINKFKSYKTLSKLESIDNLIIKEQEDPVILYHLDKSMKNYILVLVNRLKHIIASDLSQLLKTYIPSNIELSDIIDVSTYSSECKE